MSFKDFLKALLGLTVFVLFWVMAFVIVTGLLAALRAAVEFWL